MKILYLILGGAEHGVKKKILDKAASIRMAGGDITVAFATPESSRVRTVCDDILEVITVKQFVVKEISGVPFFWRFSVLFAQRYLYRTVSTHLANRTFDVLLVRYPLSDYFFHQFVARFCKRSKIVFEHNTIELKELRIRSRESFWFTYFHWGEKIFGRSTRSRASGLIAVTDEIRDWQRSLSKSATPNVTISNGIQVDRVKQKTEHDDKREILKLLFLAGSEAPWHGVDILLNSLSKYKGPARVHCYIVGHIHGHAVAQAERMQNITLLTHRTADELDAIVDDCHIGIGSLGLYRNQMRQGCTLKVREYWARGLPFVIGYEDIDLIRNTSMAPFYRKLSVRIGEYKPSFEMEHLIEFASEVSKISNRSETMRRLAKNTIDYSVKARQYLDFLRTIAQ